MPVRIDTFENSTDENISILSENNWKWMFGAKDDCPGAYDDQLER